MPSLCILACSPRRGGNSDAAARLAAQSAAASGVEVDLIHLRDHKVRPCIACDFCLSHPGMCSLDDPGQDDAGLLFSRMQKADGLLLAAPVYFYGPPAQLKALIDRAQRFWALTAEAGDGIGGPAPAFALLCAARLQGERLFDASLLIVRCFLRAVGRELTSSLLLRGLDGPRDLDRRPDLASQAEALGREAARICGACSSS